MCLHTYLSTYIPVHTYIDVYTCAVEHVLVGGLTSGFGDALNFLHCQPKPGASLMLPNLNSLKGGCIGHYIAEYTWAN